MKISCRKKIADESKKDAIVVPVYKNMSSLTELVGERLGGEIKKILESDYFNFDDNEITNSYIEINEKLKKVYLIDIPKEPDSLEVYRELGAKMVAIALKDKISSFSLLAFEDIYKVKKEFNCTTSFLEGVLYSLYSFDTYKSKKDSELLDEVEVITSTNRLKTYIDSNSDEWLSIFEHVNIAKDLINMPPNEFNPTYFAEYAKKNSHDNIKCEILDEKQMAKEGINLINAVGRGSGNKPKLIKLTYLGDKDRDQNIALVGKGVTFDSGGTNLKPTGFIEMMKSDMGGGGAIYALTNLIATQGLKVNIHTYIPVVENIIGSDALRPGDIIKSYSGKTIEVLNTDAEGRLILADALYMATKTDPEIIIDMATLTGACVVALGEHCAGLFSNRKFLSKQMSDVSAKVGEDVWELPLYEDYAKQLKSDNADLKNIGASRYGGSIVAALFLKEFVDNYSWIHLDVAGPAFLDSKHKVFGKQATGFGVRLLYHFIKQYYVSE